jgi:hypothetical protein
MDAPHGKGTKVLIEPGGLRRGATRLRDATVELNQVSSRVDGEGMPEMPPGMTAFVRTQLERIAALLADQTVTYQESAVELDRRAFWTDISDAMVNHAQLTGAQYRTFVSYLKDGTLVGYAEPWQAELAGSYVGTLYRSQLEDPERMTELSDILAQNEGNAGFSAGFVESSAPAVCSACRVRCSRWRWRCCTGRVRTPGSDRGRRSQLRLPAWRSGSARPGTGSSGTRSSS